MLYYLTRKNIISGLLIFSLVLFLSPASAQQLEFFGGISTNNFYDLKKEKHLFSSEYRPGLGFALGVGISDLKLGRRMNRFRLDFEQYGGALNVFDGGKGSSTRTKILAKKICDLFSVLSIKF